MKVLYFSDLHFPYEDKKSVDKVLAAVKAEKPDSIIVGGDLYDQHIFYKGRRSLKSYSADQEMSLARTKAEKLFAQIKVLSPKSKINLLMGNHDMRMRKRVQEKLPELEFLFDKIENDAYSFKGVKTLKDDREYLILDGVYYVHGWCSKSIDHAKHFNAPCVHGHDHRAGLTTYGKIWSVSAGHLANENSDPFSYTVSKFSKWSRGYVVIIDGKPHLNLI